MEEGWGKEDEGDLNVCSYEVGKGHHGGGDIGVGCENAYHWTYGRVAIAALGNVRGHSEKVLSNIISRQV